MRQSGGGQCSDMEEKMMRRDDYLSNLTAPVLTCAHYTQYHYRTSLEDMSLPLCSYGHL